MQKARSKPLTTVKPPPCNNFRITESGRIGPGTIKRKDGDGGTKALKELNYVLGRGSNRREKKKFLIPWYVRCTEFSRPCYRFLKRERKWKHAEKAPAAGMDRSNIKWMTKANFHSRDQPKRKHFNNKLVCIQSGKGSESQPRQE